MATDYYFSMNPGKMKVYDTEGSHLYTVETPLHYQPDDAVAVLLDPYRGDPRGNVTAFLADGGFLGMQAEEELRVSREMATKGRYTGERRPPEERKYQKPADRPEPLPLKQRKRLLSRKRS